MLLHDTYRFLKKACLKISGFLVRPIVSFLMKLNRVQIGKRWVSNGIPVIDVYKDGHCKIGNDFRMNNGSRHNKIGRQQPCFFVVLDNAFLTIGNNVGISSTAMVCHQRITIGDNVKIGGNVLIYDTDFHSLDRFDRRDRTLDFKNKKTAEVLIQDDVFIGSHSIILKGVTIGEGSIVGAGSVVTKSIPPNEVWGGNPAKFIRSGNTI